MRVLFLTLMLLMSGCSLMVAKSYNHHESYKLPSQVALVKGVDQYRKGPYNNAMIKIDAINNVSLPGKGAYSVELLPGTYILSIFYVMPYGEVEYYGDSELVVTVGAGKIYQIEGHLENDLKHTALTIEEIEQFHSSDIETYQ